MIAIAIFEDITQIVVGKKVKNKLEIKSLISYKSIYEAYINRDVNSLTMYLDEIVSLTKSKTDIYFILPDDKFNVDYFYYPTNSEKQKDIDKFLQTNNIDTNKYYYSLPFNLKSTTFSWKTVYSIEKTYIDSLLQASKNVNLLIKSIEPLSFCAIRYKNTFQQETYIFEIYKYSASIVMYSPLAGLFKMNLSKEYTIDNLKTKNSSMMLSDALLQANAVAKNKFKAITGNADIHILSTKENISKLTFASTDENARIYKMRPNSNLIVKKYNQIEIDTYYIGIGSLLQELEPPRLKYIKINSANILPEIVKESTKLIELEQNIKKTSKIALFIFTFIIGIQAAYLYYLNTIAIPDKLQLDFDYANKQIITLKKEDSIIQSVKKQTEPIQPILSEILISKPDNNTLGFTKLSINNSQNDKNNDWIKIDLVATEPMKIQEFSSNLNSDRFKNIMLTKIDNTVENINSAEISITKVIKDTPKKNKNTKKEKDE
ncbi:hypothetical protein [Megamonas funiformis]|jgi:hypothetical protein|uniref:hypothetical protein n=3 Tax=Megamonas funiformis TaxID=437897 RepID=UPI001CD51328|nr:hypothetical protein [Megamonas funiformis]UBS48705.1 hypothetical protein LCQ45_11315 [Megamonas funiformis]GLU97922.1 hypothetical protein Mfun01_05670 [Megamonas funiformis]